MSQLEAIGELFNSINYVSAFVIIIAAVIVKKLLNEFIALFDIETPSMKKERERKSELEKLKNQFELLRSQQKENKESSKELNEQIADLKKMLNNLTLASMKSTLWRIHTESVNKGYITKEGLNTFTQCGQVYEKAGGDDIYHDKLYPEVMALPVKDGKDEIL